MSYQAPNWANGQPPAINANRLNDLCTTVQNLDETMPTKQDKLTFDNAPTSGSSNPVKSSGIYTALQGKQSTLTFDNAPTSGSNNPVKSSGIYTALQGKQGTLTFDSAPTQGSANPVTSGGVYSHRVVAGQKSGETLGQSATSEGVNTVASGGISHAEGSQTTASGYCSHSEGFNTVSSGTNSHAEGASTNAEGNSSHAEGFGTEARGAYQHVFGMFNAFDPAGDSFDPSEKGTYAEIVGNGDAPTSSGRSNARTLDWDGNEVLAGSITPNGGVKGYVIAGQLAGSTLGDKATAEGRNTTASAAYCHAEGWGTTASKTGAHSEGYNTVASESYSHAEGYESEASDGAAHAEGWGTTASGNYSHSEGADTTSSGAGSHAEGNTTTASGDYSHAEGQNTLAQGEGSHAEGLGTVASDDYQHVFGKYNIAMSGYAEIVGWGTSDTARNFIRTLDTTGNMMIIGSLTQGSDARLKTVDGDVPDVSNIHAVRFRWNDGRDNLHHVGYIAQDVEKVAPYMVKNNEDGYKSLDYIAFLCAKMELLERRVKELEEKKE